MALINENMGIPNKMELCLTRTRDNYDPEHPLEVSEKNFHSNYDKAMNAQARQMQGFAAPLHFQIEKAAISKVGHLPCITQRSTLQIDILDGRDTIVNFDDIYGRPENCEQMMRPHDIIERHMASRNEHF